MTNNCNKGEVPDNYKGFILFLLLGTAGLMMETEKKTTKSLCLDIGKLVKEADSIP